MNLSMLLAQASTQPTVSAPTAQALGSVAAIMLLAGAIVGALSPYLAKIPVVGELPVALKTALISTLLTAVAIYVTHTLTGSLADNLMQILLESLGAAGFIVNGVSNVLQSTRDAMAARALKKNP